MKALYNCNTDRKIRLRHWLSLIFFAGLFAVGCRQKEAGIRIIFTAKQATGISIASNFSADEKDSILTNLQVRLQGNTTAMLGSYKWEDNRIVFTPIIPFLPDGRYEVLYKSSITGSVKIPAALAGSAASVVGIYPAIDTVPLNLLKIYIRFSAPMQEGQSLQHISLLDENSDTIPGVFLDLQPELWDENRSILTLWLDPGRIKRELIPNLKMGNPLRAGKQYTIAVSRQWKDAQGLPLRQSFTHTFTAGGRDSISPQPENWTMQTPQPLTNQELIISFGEALDYYLLQETITIKDAMGQNITGKTSILHNGKGYGFTPVKPWQPGRYHLRVAGFLEDLAGNNLNRPFEKDLKTAKNKPQQEFFEREFVIK